MGIEFAGYAGDCRIYGRVASLGERLTDLLNAGDRITVRDVRLEALDDGHVVSAPELLLELTVYGDAVFDLLPAGQTSISGGYRVTGHFGDPRAQDCRPESGSSVTVAEAQYACRRDFVAVSAVRVG